MTSKSTEMRPLQTPFQKFLLVLHAYFIMACVWMARPFVWAKEQVDGGTNYFRNYNNRKGHG